VEAGDPGERRHSSGNVYTNVRRRSVERQQSRWWIVVKAFGHGLAAALLLAAEARRRYGRRAGWAAGSNGALEALGKKASAMV